LRLQSNKPAERTGNNNAAWCGCDECDVVFRWLTFLITLGESVQRITFKVHIRAHRFA
jgi:hypothetical protein